MRFMMMAVHRTGSGSDRVDFRATEGQGAAAPYEAAGANAAAKMMEYNKSLQKAGVLLALDGLFPDSMGTRITYTVGKPTVSDGPPSESKDVIGGYWIIQVRSREEAIEWAKRAPMSSNDVIEVRQIRELSDFPADAQTAAEGFEAMLR